MAPATHRTDWISLWNQQTRADHERAWGIRGGVDLIGIYVPYPWTFDPESQKRPPFHPGNRVYVVGIYQGELVLISRVVVSRITCPSVRMGGGWIDLDAKRGTEIEVRFNRFLRQTETDALRYLNKDGEIKEFVREKGQVSGNPFQGRSSIRELAGKSAEILEKRLERP